MRRGALGLGLAAARGVGPCTWTIDVDACDASSADPSPHPGTRQRTHGKDETRQDSEDGTDETGLLFCSHCHREYNIYTTMQRERGH